MLFGISFSSRYSLDCIMLCSSHVFDSPKCKQWFVVKPNRFPRCQLRSVSVLSRYYLRRFWALPKYTSKWTTRTSPMTPMCRCLQQWFRSRKIIGWETGFESRAGRDASAVKPVVALFKPLTTPTADKRYDTASPAWRKPAKPEATLSRWQRDKFFAML